MINKEKPVLVTGATGYVAGWIVKELLEAGITVHAAVRDPKNEKKLAHLNEMASKSQGQINYFKSDLLEPGSYSAAMEGCELVYHTASPFTTDVKDAKKELIDPALKGTENVLNSANESESVKRVVLTSSCAAIYTDAIDCQSAPNNMLTEDIWNTTASLDHQPYSYSKMLAEQRAWEMNKEQTRWDLVVLNPSMVVGPATNPNTATSESFQLLKQTGDGTLKSGVPNMGVGFVDVRDLAKAHLSAGFKEEANGRHILSGHNSSFLEMAQELHKMYGKEYKVPNKALPKWLLSLIGPMVNKAITRKFVKNNVNIEWKADNSKSKKELGVQYRPLKESLKDSFEVLIKNDMVAKR
jgi:dihydroflavonol-4-reductase